MEEVTEFIHGLLGNIIHHRNQLKHYRNVSKIFKEMFDCIEIDVDFSEKLTVPLKYEPQSMHWSHSQVIVHSGILKESGDKWYHPYLSDDMVQDHNFVGLALDKMLGLNGMELLKCGEETMK